MESKTREYKEEFTRSFLKTVSAFANYETGEVLFGVSDEGKTVGASNPKELALAIENSINDSISPVPRYTIETINAQGKNVVKLTVYQGKDKPYLYKGRAYKRSDTADVEVERLELNRLTLEGQNMSFEQLTAANQDLTFTQLSDALKAAVGISELDKNVLKTLRLFSDVEGFNNAAAVFADINDFTGIDIVKFGSDITEIADRCRAIGVSILSQLDAAMEMYRKYYQYEKIDSLARKTVSMVPEVAFREAVVNALIHRFWDSNANVQISMTNESITVVSPGGLPSEITWEDYLAGRVSILRNAIIAGVFFRMDYVEIFGTGVARIRNAYKGSRVQPQFEKSDSLLTVILPVVSALDESTLSVDERAVLNVFSDSLILSRQEVEQATGFSQSKCNRLLGALETKGFIEKTGKGRATRYKGGH